VGRGAGLDGCRKSRPRRDSTPDRPARSESLNRLSYPGTGQHILLLKKSLDLSIAFIEMC
jgi:hypothetical protein